jgi:hydroxypyruvate isomerase
VDSKWDHPASSGEINYRKIFEHVYHKAKATNREFVWGMEHGNARPGKEGGQALIAAFRESDNFKE